MYYLNPFHTVCYVCVISPSGRTVEEAFTVFTVTYYITTCFFLKLYSVMFVIFHILVVVH